MTSENNKRIAKNTAMLYLRMLFTMLVSLYTSRVVLNTLGVDDFGIYNVVGGVVTMFSFLNSAMSSGTQRFLSFELGKKDYEQLKRIFSMSINIHASIAIIIFILAETIGLWFLNTQLTIPDERMVAANWVYQFSILAFIVTIMSVPYNAAIISHERMSIFAYVSILEVTLKLVIVFILQWFGFDKLKLYAILVFLVSLIIRIIYGIYCKHNFKESTNNGNHYEYAISKTKEEITSGSKTKYYPVTLANVFSQIDKIEGSVAIVGVGCFIKAIRLAQYSNPILKNKIKFLVGIICGGVKSSFFSQYPASKAGVQATAYSNPEFRVKDINSTASDYSFSCFDKTKNEYKTIKMRSVGDMWGTGLFKNNACDFCDDVTTELADISLGDAWLPAYDNDGKGNNIIISRSALSKRIINEGIDSKELILNSVSSETIISSQQGSFSHRHSGLQYRINKYKKKRKLVPPKRVKQPFFNISFKAVQSLRMLVRYKSLVIWNKFPDAVIFENKIKMPLIWLQKMTHIYHIEKRLRNKIKSFNITKYK